MNGRETTRFHDARGLVAHEAHLATAHRRIRAANVALYTGFVTGAGGAYAYVFFAPTASWWVAALIFLLPFLGGIGVSRRIVRGL
jgi:hypothetical protein